MAKKYYIYNDIAVKWYKDDVVSSAEDLSKFFAENADDEIELHINSMGGEVYEAEAMVTAIKNHPKKVTAYIDGIAASCASFIALACDDVKMARRAEIFIHKAHTYTCGNADDLRRTADDLEKTDEKIVEIYKSKAKSEGTDFLAMMTADNFGTTLNGEEAAAIWDIKLIEEPAKTISDTKMTNIAAKLHNYKPKDAKKDEKEGKTSQDIELFTILN